MGRTIIVTVAVLGALLGLSGCSTYSEQSRHITEAWQAGNASLAATHVTLKAEQEAGSRDELIWRLEQGTILSAVGEYEDSLRAFDQAEALVNRYEMAAGLKVGNEAFSMLSTQANRVYRGRAYDKVMMNTYKALNCLWLSDRDRARVELNRALQRQRDAVAENEKKIEAALDAAEQAESGELREDGGGTQPAYDVERAQEDERFAAAVDGALAEVDGRILPYADYVNPFSVFLDGLFFSHCGDDAADIERARKDFERVRGMSPGSYIDEDYAMAEAMAAGAPADCMTYVLFATGSAPSREEVRIDIPLFLVTDDVAYVGAAFPLLLYHDDFIPQMTASANGRTFRSERLCSMDAVVSRDFKNEWPAILTRTLLTTAAKATAGHAAEEALNDNPLGALVVQAISLTYQSATNIADTRTWTTLPKEFSYIRMPTPPDGELFLQIGAVTRAVRVDAGKTNVVLVRSVNRFAPPILKQLSMN